MGERWRSTRYLIAAVVTAALAACASPASKLTPGQSKTADVTAAMGKPTLTYTNAAGETVWMYRSLQSTYAVRMRPDGTVVAVEQRLTKEYWSQIAAGRTTGKEVRELLGPPDRVVPLALQKNDEWRYRVLMDNRDHDFQVYVGPDGVVQRVDLLQVPTM